MHKVQIKRYKTIPDFFQDSLSFLEQNEAANNLTIGIPKSILEAKADSASLNLYSILQEDSVIFCLVQTEPRNFLIYGKKDISDGSLELMITRLIKDKIPTSGVIGPKSLAIRFAKLWQQQSGQDYKVNFRQWVYQLDTLQTIKLSSGLLRPAQQFDASIVEKWVIDFSRMAVINMTAEQAWEFTISKIKEQTLFIWEDQGKVVSMAAVARPSTNGITINYVYTPVELRGQGYASSCVMQLSKLMLEKYKFCALFTDADNPTSNKIYQNIGYYPLEEFRELKFL